MQQSTSFWITGPERGELRSEELAPPGPGEVLVRTLYSGVSRGTESLVWHGLIPESQHNAMRAPFQTGAFPFPVKYGYIAVGEVVEGPVDLQGKAVFCLHPHQTAFIVPAESLTSLPDELPPARAVLAANMETALNAFWDAQAEAGQPAAVIGAGVVGCLVAALLRKAGVPLTLVDRDPAKREIANALELPFALPDDLRDEFSLLVHSSGNPQGLRFALTKAAPEGRIIELSWFGDQQVSLPLGEAFHSRRLTLRSSQVGALSPNAPVGSYSARMALALEALCDPCFEALINSEGEFESLPRDYPRLMQADSGVLCHRVLYPES